MTEKEELIIRAIWGTSKKSKLNQQQSWMVKHKPKLNSITYEEKRDSLES